MGNADNGANRSSKVDTAQLNTGATTTRVDAEDLSCEHFVKCTAKNNLKKKTKMITS